MIAGGHGQNYLRVASLWLVEHHNGDDLLVIPEWYAHLEGPPQKT